MGTLGSGRVGLVDLLGGGWCWSGWWEREGNDPCSRATQSLLDCAYTSWRASAWEGRATRSLEGRASGRRKDAAGGFPAGQGMEGNGTCPIATQLSH